MAHERTVPCPYDPIHEIREGALMKHILKCAKNFPDVKLETCPLNSAHRIRKEKLQQHLRECPDRGILERELFSSPGSVVSAAVPCPGGNPDVKQEPS